MKKRILNIFILSFAVVVSIVSCKKEHSCEGCINGNRPPIAIAGPDQVINLPTDSVSLDGSASNDPDGTISSFLWTKISGPSSFSIKSAASAITVAKSLAAGAYQFELRVTDNAGLSAKDTIRVTVNDLAQPNRPPVANAGPDQTIILPVNLATLDGSASTDPDNNIAGYLWTKISGPSSFSITNANAVQAQITNLVQGIYQFELTVTDSGGLFSKATVQVTINAPVIPCNNSNWPVIDATLSPIGSLSEPRLPNGGAIGNKVVFAGGEKSDTALVEFDCSEIDLGTAVVDIYDVITHLWSTAQLSKARLGMSVVSHGNKIFFAGGYSWDFFPGGEWHVSYDNVDIYDASTNTWEVAHLSQVRSGIAGAAIGNKVFFAGGSNFNTTTSSQPSNAVDIYDEVTHNWSTATLSVARSIQGVYAVVLNDKIYFAGGNSSNTVDIYNNSTSTWTVSGFQAVIASLLPPQGMGIIDKFDVKGDNIIFWSGQNQVGIRNLTTGATTIGCLPGRAPAYLVNNTVVFLAPGGQFNIYDPASGVWSTGVIYPAFPPIRWSPGVISLNNTIYIGGVYDPADNNSCFFGSRVFSLTW